MWLHSPVSDDMRHVASGCKEQGSTANETELPAISTCEGSHADSIRFGSRVLKVFESAAPPGTHQWMEFPGNYIYQATRLNNWSNRGMAQKKVKHSRVTLHACMLYCAPCRPIHLALTVYTTVYLYRKTIQRHKCFCYGIKWNYFYSIYPYVYSSQAHHNKSPSNN